MTALLLLLKPFLPYVIGAVTLLVGGTGYVWNAKRKARNEGIAEQKAKEAEANAQELDRIRAAAGAQPSGSVSNDPNNRDPREG